MCSSWCLAPAIAAAVAIYLSLARPGPLVEAAPLLALWFFSPLWASWIGRPLTPRAPALTAEQITFLQKLSRKTWAFFETFVGPEDHWLPPDNFQENPMSVVSHRTSPTNMGLALLANLAAYDFGYISAGKLIERTENAFGTMETLQRHRGHFYNWYDTQTLQPLQPLYVSTVDSGNLAGHLLTLQKGLLELPAQPVLAPRFFEGIQHTLSVLMDVAGVDLRNILDDAGTTLEICLERLEGAVAGLNLTPGSEAEWWADALLRQCRDGLDDLREPAAERVKAVRCLAVRAERLASMEYDFLFDEGSRLLCIGYHASERRLDSSYYDLLASEARFASFVAIAQGQVPQENWFALGRLLTTFGGDPALVSWSGSMFEYLMPLLVMPTYENTLLDQTSKAAVKRQIDYGKEVGVPWGISESGYNIVDVHLNYQYRAFGVPGLGFKRGLAEDVVIAPYASALALMVVPEEACSNLQRLASAGLECKYGLYEAIDYTPSRLPRGQSSAVVRSVMAHHQGMTFLSLAHLLLEQPMQRRFQADPLFQATLLLLQERIPKAVRHYPTTARFSSSRIGSNDQEAPVRVFNSPNTPAPEIQLLSNGRYHVMVTNAGGGYSQWKDIALTRWREDSTRDNRGTFFYLRDVTSGAVWSVAYPPARSEPKSYEAIFSEARVEFRRSDNDIDTHTEIAVSPEDDIELRRIRITNSSRTRRVIDVTSYAEIVLAPPAADALHPAFSNLFVQTEIVPERHAILCTRRPRSAGEATPWMFHLIAAESATADEVSYETDRMRFIGRGKTVADPQAHASDVLSGTDGSVLDPIVAIRCRITLDPDETATLNVVSGVGQTRELCMGLVDKYRDPRFASRTFDLAWTHSQVLLRQINATEGDAQLYGRLASSVIYANSTLRAAPSLLVKNRRNQSGLWGYAISGDLPIVLLRIGDPTHIDLVRQLVQAHAYWRFGGVAGV